MWIAYDHVTDYAQTGNTPSQAFEKLDELISEVSFDEVSFYEVEKETPMKQEIIPATIITPKKGK